MLELSLLAFPFAAGMIAAFNPCGFAMLPTYLLYFLGLEEKSISPMHSLLKATKTSLALALGFLTVFGSFGLLFEFILTDSARSALQSNLWLVTIISGGLLIGILGIFMLKGYQPIINIPKLNVGGDNQTFISMFLFGVSYGMISLGCTIGPFLVAVTGSVASNSGINTIAAFVAYAAGMSLIIMSLTVFVAFGKQSIITKFRSFLPYVNKASSILLIFASIFLMLHGWFQKDPLNNTFPGLDLIESIQSAITNFVANISAWWFVGTIFFVVSLFIFSHLKSKGNTVISR